MNQHYLHFSVEDFIADEQFQQWVKSPDALSDKRWREWLAEHPQQKLLANLAADFILNLHFNTVTSAPGQVQHSLDRNLLRIAELEDAPTERKATRIRKSLSIGIAAAGVAAVAFFSYHYFDDHTPVMVEMVTGPGEVKTVLLPDSSSITMNENSSVSYSSSLPAATKREVWMKGEVFFNVRHLENAVGVAQQFVVYSGDLQVEVLGTAFNVKSYRSVTNVSLNNGHVKIGVRNDPVSVTLQPGDFIQYSQTEKKIIKRKVDARLYSTWKEKKLKLDKVPMQDIAQLIQDIYGYKVEINEPALRARKISGTLIVNDEKTFLETLAFAFEIDIEKQDSILRFTSKSSLKKE